MTDAFVTSDTAILDLLRKDDALTVTELADAMEVTSTAVRQRLNRLMAQELVERTVSRHGRGRPLHHYRLTDKGRRKVGSNFADLAVALWQEISQLEDLEIRRMMMKGLAKRLAVMYSDKIHGKNLHEKMQALSELFAERRVPMDVQQGGSLPVPDDDCVSLSGLGRTGSFHLQRGQMLYSELLGAEVQLASCKLDGAECCSFHSN
jgi:DeoR family transcriptional regulator, suf operon transcriptional repressor